MSVVKYSDVGSHDSKYGSNSNLYKSPSANEYRIDVYYGTDEKLAGETIVLDNKFATHENLYNSYDSTVYKSSTLHVTDSDGKSVIASQTFYPSSNNMLYSNAQNVPSSSKSSDGKYYDYSTILRLSTDTEDQVINASSYSSSLDILNLDLIHVPYSIVLIHIRLLTLFSIEYKMMKNIMMLWQEDIMHVQML